jgi:bifunctional non-homologous end joining protein LigD
MLDANGVSSFAALQESLKRTRRDNLTYQVFDILHLDGNDLTGLPLVKRQQILKSNLALLHADAPIRYSDHVQGGGAAFYNHACRLGLEGIVASSRARPTDRDAPRNGSR